MEVNLMTNYTITINNRQPIEDFQKDKLNLHFFWGVGANPSRDVKITLLTLFNTNDLAFPAYTIKIKPDTIGCRVNQYNPDEGTIIQPTCYKSTLSVGSVYTFDNDDYHPKITQNPSLTYSFVVQNNQQSSLWYALMKPIALSPNHNNYTNKIYSVFTLPPQSTLEIQAKLFAILHYSSDQLKEGQIKTSVARGFYPVRVNLTENCNSPSLTFSLDDNLWTLSGDHQSCTIENLKTVKSLSEYAITEIKPDSSDPYENLINLSVPVNFQDNQARYICGSYKGTAILPYQYPILGINCTQPTPFQLSPSSTGQTYLKENTIIEIKTESSQDLIDTSGTTNNDHCLLGYFSGFPSDPITKLCCYYYSPYKDNTKWSIVPVSDSDTFNGFIKKGAFVYLKNLASNQYLIPKAIDSNIYLTVSDQLYPWIITQQET